MWPSLFVAVVVEPPQFDCNCESMEGEDRGFVLLQDILQMLVVKYGSDIIVQRH